MRADDLWLWLALVRRQWLIILAVCAVVMVGVGVAAERWPWKYESHAKFLVRNARQELLVTPNNSSAGMLREDVSEETINSEIELIRSRDILERVVRESNLVRADVDPDPAVATERAVSALQSALTVAPIRKTNLILVSYRSRDPQLAAAVLRRLSDYYLSLHVTMHSSPGTFVLFTEQAERWRQQLVEAENAITTLGRQPESGRARGATAWRAAIGTRDRRGARGRGGADPRADDPGSGGPSAR